MPNVMWEVRWSIRQDTMKPERDISRLSSCRYTSDSQSETSKCIFKRAANLYRCYYKYIPMNKRHHTDKLLKTKSDYDYERKDLISEIVCILDKDDFTENLVNAPMHNNRHLNMTKTVKYKPKKNATKNQHGTYNSGNFRRNQLLSNKNNAFYFAEKLKVIDHDLKKNLYPVKSRCSKQYEIEKRISIDKRNSKIEKFLNKYRERKRFKNKCIKKEQAMSISSGISQSVSTLREPISMYIRAEQSAPNMSKLQMQSRLKNEIDEMKKINVNRKLNIHAVTELKQKNKTCVKLVNKSKNRRFLGNLMLTLSQEEIKDKTEKNNTYNQNISTKNISVTNMSNKTKFILFPYKNTPFVRISHTGNPNDSSNNRIVYREDSKVKRNNINKETFTGQNLNMTKRSYLIKCHYTKMYKQHKHRPSKNLVTTESRINNKLNNFKKHSVCDDLERGKKPRQDFSKPSSTIIDNVNHSDKGRYPVKIKIVTRPFVARHREIRKRNGCKVLYKKNVKSHNIGSSISLGVPFSNTNNKFKVFAAPSCHLNFFDNVLKTKKSNYKPPGNNHTILNKGRDDINVRFSKEYFIKSSRSDITGARRLLNRYFCTMNVRIKGNLEPYECEPGYCIPGECDPYICQKRIQNRLMGNISKVSQATMSRSIPLTPITSNSPQMRNKMIPSTKTRIDHPQPQGGIKYKSLPNKRRSQAVRVGSTFSFDIEFSKKRGQDDKFAKDKGQPKYQDFHKNKMHTKNDQMYQNKIHPKYEDVYDKINYKSDKFSESPLRYRDNRSLKYDYSKNKQYFKDQRVHQGENTHTISKQSKLQQARSRYKTSSMPAKTSTPQQSTVKTSGKKSSTSSSVDDCVCLRTLKKIEAKENRQKKKKKKKKNIKDASNTPSTQTTTKRSNIVANKGNQSTKPKTDAIKTNNQGMTSTFSMTTNPKPGTKISQMKSTLSSHIRRCFCTSKILVPNGKPQTASTHNRPLRSKGILDFNACEPFVCTPNRCNPYVCLEIKRNRNKRIDTEYPKKISMSNITSNKRPFGKEEYIPAQISDPAKYDNFETNKQTKMPHDTTPKEPIRPNSSNSLGRRQAVRIGSTFSFHIEFYKDRFPKTSEIAAAAKAVKRKSQKIGGKENTKHKGLNTNNKMLDQLSQVSKTNTDKSISTMMPKKCFCTLKIKNPYMCEHGVCTPGECNPHECLLRLQKRYMKDSSVFANFPERPSVVSNTSSVSQKIQTHRLEKSSRSKSAVMQTQRSAKSKQSKTAVKKSKRPKRPKRNRGMPLKNAVRFGSSYKFDIEFYKDTQDTFNEENFDGRKCREAKECISQDKTCRKKCRDICNEKEFSSQDSVPVQDRYSQPSAPNNFHNRHSQSSFPKMHSSMTETNILKRCFCTLKLNSYKNNPQQMSSRPNVYFSTVHNNLFAFETNIQNKNNVTIKNISKQIHQQNTRQRESYSKNINFNYNVSDNQLTFENGFKKIASNNFLTKRGIIHKKCFDNKYQLQRSELYQNDCSVKRNDFGTISLLNTCFYAMALQKIQKTIPKSQRISKKSHDRKLNNNLDKLKYPHDCTTPKIEKIQIHSKNNILSNASKQIIRLEKKGVNCLKRCFCTLNFQNITLNQSTQKTITTNRKELKCTEGLPCNSSEVAQKRSGFDNPLNVPDSIQNKLQKYNADPKITEIFIHRKICKNGSKVHNNVKISGENVNLGNHFMELKSLNSRNSSNSADDKFKKRTLKSSGIQSLLCRCKNMFCKHSKDSKCNADSFKYPQSDIQLKKHVLHSPLLKKRKLKITNQKNKEISKNDFMDVNKNNSNLMNPQNSHIGIFESNITCLYCQVQNDRDKKTNIYQDLSNNKQVKFPFRSPTQDSVQEVREVNERHQNFNTSAQLGENNFSGDNENSTNTCYCEPIYKSKTCDRNKQQEVQTSNYLKRYSSQTTNFINKCMHVCNTFRNDLLRSANNVIVPNTVENFDVTNNKLKDTYAEFCTHKREATNQACNMYTGICQCHLSCAKSICEHDFKRKCDAIHNLKHLFGNDAFVMNSEDCNGVILDPQTKQPSDKKDLSISINRKKIPKESIYTESGTCEKYHKARHEKKGTQQIDAKDITKLNGFMKLLDTSTDGNLKFKKKGLKQIKCIKYDITKSAKQNNRFSYTSDDLNNLLVNVYNDTQIKDNEKIQRKHFQNGLESSNKYYAHKNGGNAHCSCRNQYEYYGCGVQQKEKREQIYKKAKNITHYGIKSKCRYRSSLCTTCKIARSSLQLSEFSEYSCGDSPFQQDDVSITEQQIYTLNANKLNTYNVCPNCIYLQMTNNIKFNRSHKKPNYLCSCKSSGDRPMQQASGITLNCCLFSTPEAGQLDDPDIVLATNVEPNQIVEGKCKRRKKNHTIQQATKHNDSSWKYYCPHQKYPKNLLINQDTNLLMMKNKDILPITEGLIVNTNNITLQHKKHKFDSNIEVPISKKPETPLKCNKIFRKPTLKQSSTRIRNETKTDAILADNTHLLIDSNIEKKNLTDDKTSIKSSKTKCFCEVLNGNTLKEITIKTNAQKPDKRCIYGVPISVGDIIKPNFCKSSDSKKCACDLKKEGLLEPNTKDKSKHRFDIIEQSIFQSKTKRPSSKLNVVSANMPVTKYKTEKKTKSKRELELKPKSESKNINRKNNIKLESKLRSESKAPVQSESRIKPTIVSGIESKIKGISKKSKFESDFESESKITNRKIKINETNIESNSKLKLKKAIASDESLTTTSKVKKFDNHSFCQCCSKNVNGLNYVSGNKIVENKKDHQKKVNNKKVSNKKNKPRKDIKFVVNQKKSPAIKRREQSAFQRFRKQLCKRKSGPLIAKTDLIKTIDEASASVV
ncbi:uncharacterized protein LOC128682977 isoform X2 [Plodia interpunctella]|uniref:uncharacterized protein LOC128682977 isoform X2 n=1 Tax=Plodia interpunctella TaxID=58824 RepID=UPI0023687BAC|nr:uncharacterized protein LOC128682977 isoform X2 [Plodia interpunctella]